MREADLDAGITVTLSRLMAEDSQRVQVRLPLIPSVVIYPDGQSFECAMWLIAILSLTCINSIGALHCALVCCAAGTTVMGGHLQGHPSAVPREKGPLILALYCTVVC